LSGRRSQRMAKKKKKPAVRKKSVAKKRGAKKRPSGPGLRERLAGLAPGIRPAAYVAASLALVVGVGLGAGALRAEAAERLSVEDAEEVEIAIDWPLIDPEDPQRGTWLTPGQRASILETARSAAARHGGDALDPSGLRDVVTELAASGWFVGMPVAKRDGEGRIAIEAEWRTPAAVVRVGGVDHLVSWGVMPMPVRYDAGASSQPVILGAPGLTPERYSQPWPSDAVAAAIELLRVLVVAGFRDQVFGIDVDRFGERELLEIVTPSGNRVVWGSPPGEFRPGEATQAEKLERLERLRERYGSIDAGQDGLKIYTANVEVDRRPNAPAPNVGRSVFP